MASFEIGEQLSQPIALYLQYLQSDRQLAANTLANYRSDLRALGHFVADYRITLWRQLSAKQAQAFVSDRQLQQRSALSTARLVSCIKGFFSYLRRQKILDTDLLLGLQLPAPSTISTHPAVVDIDRLLDIAADDFLSTRDRALLALICSSGIKVAEVAALDLFSVDFAQRALRIERKNHPAVIIPISKSTLEAVKAWFTYRSAQLAMEPALFITKSGRRLSIRAIQQRINARGRQLGLAALSANQLRRAYYQQLIAAEVNIETISRHLGKTVSSSGQSNQQASDIQQLLASYNSAHPRAKKR